MNPDIYSLKLHESIKIEGNYGRTEILRVPGGWLYKSYDYQSGGVALAFVSYHNEFLEVDDRPY